MYHPHISIYIYERVDTDVLYSMILLVASEEIAASSSLPYAARERILLLSSNPTFVPLLP